MLSRSFVAVAFAVLTVGTASCKKEEPVAPPDFVARGDEYLAQGETGEAILEYQRAIRQKRSDGEAYRKLGYVYLRTGELDFRLFGQLCGHHHRISRPRVGEPCDWTIPLEV